MIEVEIVTSDDCTLRIRATHGEMADLAISLCGGRGKKRTKAEVQQLEGLGKLIEDANPRVAQIVSAKRNGVSTAGVTGE